MGGLFMTAPIRPGAGIPIPPVPKHAPPPPPGQQKVSEVAKENLAAAQTSGENRAIKATRRGVDEAMRRISYPDDPAPLKNLVELFEREGEGKDDAYWHLTNLGYTFLKHANPTEVIPGKKKGEFLIHFREPIQSAGGNVFLEKEVKLKIKEEKEGLKIDLEGMRVKFDLLGPLHVSFSSFKILWATPKPNQWVNPTRVSVSIGPVSAKRDVWDAVSFLNGFRNWVPQKKS
jgi:hypothetical protein